MKRMIRPLYEIVIPSGEKRLRSSRFTESKDPYSTIPLRVRSIL
jgi:hypothetical protein